MSRYLIKRFLYMIPMLFLVILFVYLIMSFTPGDPATNNLPLTTPQQVKDAYNERVGYTGTVAGRFFGYLKGLASGNVLSYTSGENIFTELGKRLPLTLRLGLLSFSIAALLGVGLGILSAVKQYSFLDSSLTVIAVLFS